MHSKPTHFFYYLLVCIAALQACGGPQPHSDTGLDDRGVMDVVVNDTAPSDTPRPDVSLDAPEDVSHADVPIEIPPIDVMSDAPQDTSDACAVGPCANSSAPSLLSPHNGANTGHAGTGGNPIDGTPLRPIFRWVPVQGATRYEAQWTSSCVQHGFANCSFGGESTQTVFTNSVQPIADLPISTVQPVGTRYFWRVRACQGANLCSQWSAVRYVNVGRVNNDYNGDGFSDAVVGAPNATFNGAVRAGAVSMYVGSPTGLAATPARVLGGSAVGDTFGYSIAGAGDINADGYSDLIVGAYGATVQGMAAAGTASVYLGNATGVSSTPAQLLEGINARDTFGFSVSSAGDVNADGLSDVIVGANHASPGGRAEAGTVSIFLGTMGGIAMTPSRVLEGTSGSDWFGYSVSEAGDVNSDGFSDVIVGAYLSDPGGLNAAGSAYVYMGEATGVAPTPARTMVGAGTGHFLGIRVACAGDTNGDGYSDVVVGSTGATPGTIASCGAALVYHGSAMGVEATPSRVLQGVLSGDSFGQGVQTAGDVNNDGYADVLVGASFADVSGRTNTGTVSVFHGASGGVGVTPERMIQGIAAEDRMGLGVAGVGDVNGDGFGDILAGAYLADPSGRSSAGTVSVFHGSATGIPATPVRTYEGVAAGDQFGTSVARVESTHRARDHVVASAWWLARR